MSAACNEAMEQEKEEEEGGTPSADSANALAPTPKPTPSQTGMRSWPTPAALWRKTSRRSRSCVCAAAACEVGAG